ncbi:MAG: PilZ domain-containing protein [Gammaproteobacteria bacterium]|nr:PilZ domain-containing protein [Gammaproteobacteria bacterium]
MTDQFIERRRQTRHPVQARMRITNNFIGILEGYSRDISNAGVFIYLTPVPPIARGGYLGLQMLESANPTILFNARVARVDPRGVAVALVDYEIDGRRYTLQELRRQWKITHVDIEDFKIRN